LGLQFGAGYKKWKLVMKKFEDIKVGDTYTLQKTISESDIKKFVDITGDVNPLHINKEYAAATPFKDIVVHGMLGASFISTIIGTKLPGPGSLWVSQNFNFLLPTRLNDRLSITCTVAKVIPKERLLNIEATIYNQNKQLILNGSGVVRLLTNSKPTLAIKKDVNKVAIVTGGTGGIGQAICKKLFSMGFNIAFTYMNSPERAELLVKDLSSKDKKAIAIKADISSDADLTSVYEKTIAEFGSVSVLVNNASSRINPKLIAELDWEDLQAQLITQLKGTIMLSRFCAPKMMQERWGRIINITSQVLNEEPTQGWGAYSIAKAALHQASKHMAQEFGIQGVTVNCIAPGMCETALIGDIPEKIQLMIARQTPLRRLAEPKDIANAVGFLVSESADFITGQSINVNGGIRMR
jgi:3-oxoacyl-[acyl-carrier protein] reductase